MTHFSIIEYCEELEDQIQGLERTSAQGKRVSLQMVMSSTLDRTRVFDQFKCYVAVAHKKTVGVIHAAKSYLLLDGEQVMAGIPMNLRVHENYRHQGIAKALVSYANENFFKPLGITYLFTTTKKSNSAVQSIAKVVQRPVYKFPFEYLTVPSYARIRQQLGKNSVDTFKVFAPQVSTIDDQYSISIGDGVGIWRTDLMYSLRITRLAPALRLALATANIFRPSGKKLPQINSEMKFCTLYGLTSSKVHLVNTALRHAEMLNIDFVNICCARNGAVYNIIHRKAITRYPYLLLTTKDLNAESQVEIDVRCL